MKRDSTIVPLVTLLATLAVTARAFGDDPRSQAEEVILAGNCLLEYGKSTVIGANQPGAIREITVRHGDRVKAGQSLGRLRDQDLRAELEVLKADADNMNLIKIAEAKYNKALIAMDVNKKIVSRRIGLVSGMEVNQQVQETEGCKYELEQARFAQRLNRLRRDQLAAAVQLKEFTSPHDGIVVDVFKKDAESVTVNAEIMRIVNTDVFRVAGVVDLNDSWRVKNGQKVRVSPEVIGNDLSVEKETFFGELVFVDREIDPKTQTCRVVAEIKNRDDLLRAGLQVRMEIIRAVEPDPPAPAGAAAPAPKNQGPTH